MHRTTRTILVTAAAATVLAGGAALATPGEDGADRPVTGDALARASEAALASTGGGTVTGTEVGDEDSYYEIEVTLDDGRQVDVQLDASFSVVDTMADHEETGSATG
ncbi:PepSY domain-containing protein [Cellulomonas sp. ICMP 17802]|uniref:PepSY domain-containing protein n=1 Tax=Cellulomonas sp. ICMP 17802 TaxID=3239199 RepID=UPI00351AFA4A